MKKLNISNRLKYAASGIAICVSAVTLFQNCASKVNFSTYDQSQDASSTTPAAPAVPQYAEITSGDQSTFPPLKLIFVVDNSNSMKLNQINLSSAFSKMFDGDNSTNLAPFDSTAYILSTSQRSLRASDNATQFGRLPTKALTDYSTMSLASILKGPRAQTLDGSIAGDIVGFRLNTSTTNGLTTNQYVPAPVSLFAADGGGTDVSLAAHKVKGGSVTDFAQDFSDRIAVLNPDRSAIDSATQEGVLDAVVDQESGLCALSRAIRHKSDYLNPGDLAAYIIVSDEDDNDPKGLNCVESYAQVNSTDSFVDGSCKTPKTNLSYHAVNTNPSVANCSVSYDTGFNYTYSYNQPETDISYEAAQRDYKVRQTLVSYSYATNTYSQPEYTVSYYTSAPTYQLPQTAVSYYTKTATCTTIRDTTQQNCTNTYAGPKTVTLSTPYTDCTTFLKTNTPSGAVTGDSAHPLTCAVMAPIAKSGSCSATDTSKLNCQQNISATLKKSASVAGLVPATAAACATAEAGLGDSSAVLNDSAHAPVCAAATALAGQKGKGLCPTDGSVTNCTNTITKTVSSAITGVAASASADDCMAYAVKNKSYLNANAVLSNGSYGVTCAEGAGKTVSNEAGVCSSLTGTTYANCTDHPAAAATTATVKGVPTSGQTCAAFIKANVSSPSTISATGAESCSLSATTYAVTSSSKSIAYTDSSVASYTAVAGGDCLAALKSKIASSDGITAPITSCTVGKLITGSKSLNTSVTCDAITDTKTTCENSKLADRNCSATSVPAGTPYMAATTTVSETGTFTCSTLCSATSFCATKSGTVGDNFEGCSVADASTNRTFTHALSSSVLCQAGENPTATITKAAYRDTSTQTDYVAGTGSATAVPNALATYVKDTSASIFGTSLPSVSVFVSQTGDNLGVSGSVGASYNTFATMMGGTSQSIHAAATGYASALQNLGSVIREKLNRSFSVKIAADQTIHQLWYRKAGTTDYVLVDTQSWSATGGTVTLAATFEFAYGDQFKVEYY